MTGRWNRCVRAVRTHFSPKYPLPESEQLGRTSGNANDSPEGGATGGAHADALFARLAELWPSLSDTTRLALVATAEASQGEGSR